MRAIDMTGKRFGRWTVLERDCLEKRNAYWICRCDCGNYGIVRGDELRDGRSGSCGCLHSEIMHEKLADMRKQGMGCTHRLSNARLFNIWSQMKARCYNKNAPNYHNYGGRGIAICEEWLADFQSFYDWAVSNGYSDDLTIDRINNNGNYEPSNCRWATNTEQGENRRTSVILTYNGESHCINEWARITGIPAHVIAKRIKKGWSVEQTLTTKPKKVKRRV